MANGHGGPRTPAKPAPASGPGRLSQRTDGGPAQKIQKMTGGDYGDSQDMASLQRSAPMGATPDSGAAMQPAMPIDGGGLTALDAPTGQPHVGLMDNVGQFQQQPQTMDDATRQKLAGVLPVLMWQASQPDASEATRQFVRQLRADL